jgi:hypothetical protein
MSRDLTNSLAALTEQARPRSDDTPQPRGAARRVVSAAQPPSAKASGGGGGVASPLTEISVSGREYHQAGWKTTDGLFTLPAIKKVMFVDVNGEQVEFRFADPSS